jgi:hypothetical protein
MSIQKVKFDGSMEYQILMRIPAFGVVFPNVVRDILHDSLPDGMLLHLLELSGGDSRILRMRREKQRSLLRVGRSKIDTSRLLFTGDGGVELVQELTMCHTF